MLQFNSLNQNLHQFPNTFRNFQVTTHSISKNSTVYFFVFHLRATKTRSPPPLVRKSRRPGTCFVLPRLRRLAQVTLTTRILSCVSLPTCRTFPVQACMSTHALATLLGKVCFKDKKNKGELPVTVSQESFFQMVETRPAARPQFLSAILETAPPPSTARATQHLWEDCISPRGNTPHSSWVQWFLPSAVTTLKMVCRTENRWTVKEER